MERKRKCAKPDPPQRGGDCPYYATSFAKQNLVEVRRRRIFRVQEANLR
ncbi:MAG: hypothetical protein II921_06070 [Treponema sp.]|nr:hypothetical protein [Treponema sp.]